MKHCNQCRSTYPADFTSCPKDQSVLVSANELTEGMLVRGKYEVVEKIGVGGMATVYRVRHIHLQEDVAIKVVNAALAADADFLQRFQTEAVITRRLHHPNAVRLDDFDVTEDGRPFIVMEFVRGKSLRSLLKEGWLSPARSASIARQVALALGAAHELGIIHRDIKPDNILLVTQADGTELVKVLDFGIAKVSGETSPLAGNQTPTRTGIVLGTPQYVSPEQAKASHSSPVDRRSDIYSLGVVLYEMLTGTQPFHADNPFDLLAQHIQTVPTPPNLANPAARISPAMSAVVMKALEKDPGNRYQTAAEMADALSDTAVTEQIESDEGGAHAFSTAALAAAAAAVNSDPARVTVAKPIPATVAVPVPQPAPTVLMPVAAKRRVSKRSYIVACAATVLVLALFVFHRRPTTPVVDEEKPSASAQPPVTTVVRPVNTRQRPLHPHPAPRTAVPDKVRSQELTALGYRHLQQRDYDTAHDNFTEALELDPGNAAAKRGLQVAQGAQTVDTVSGVLRR